MPGLHQCVSKQHTFKSNGEPFSVMNTSPPLLSNEILSTANQLVSDRLTLAVSVGGLGSFEAAIE